MRTIGRGLGLGGRLRSRLGVCSFLRRGCGQLLANLLAAFAQGKLVFSNAIETRFISVNS
jgi:hypothetical protein